MNTYLVLILLLFSKLTFSEDNYKSVMNNCLKRQDWEKVKCSLGDAPDEVGYKESKMSTFSLNVASGLFEFFDEVLDVVSVPLYIPHLVNNEPELVLDRPELKKEAYRKLLTEFHKKNQRLNDCQRACVVKCVTANLLDFKGESRKTKFGGVEDSIAHEIGECTEYARVAKFVGRYVGVKTELVGSPVHAFVGFKINGKRYFTEPQEPACIFFTPEKTDQAEIEELETSLNQKSRYQQIYDSPGMYEGWEESPGLYSRPR